MNENLTLEQLPKAFEKLLIDVKEIKLLVTQKEIVGEKKLPINIDKACIILQKAKPTVYALVRKGLLPAYKNGKKLYFFEDELIEWIEKGKKKTYAEIQQEVILATSKR